MSGGEIEMFFRRSARTKISISPVSDAIEPVSYTHLDVYKRQVCVCVLSEDDFHLFIIVSRI